MTIKAQTIFFSRLYNTLAMTEIVHFKKIYIKSQINPVLTIPQGLLRHGYFLEAGAADGELISNTLLMETESGWTGTLVEPLPQFAIPGMKKNRSSV